MTFAALAGVTPLVVVVGVDEVPLVGVVATEVLFIVVTGVEGAPLVEVVAAAEVLPIVVVGVEGVPLVEVVGINSSMATIALSKNCCASP